MSKKAQVLGDVVITPHLFAQTDDIVRACTTGSFATANVQQKTDRISRCLSDLIQKEPTPCFLLPAVLHFIDAVNRLKVIEGYAFYHFELWLNQFSDFSEEENQAIRMKIAGKQIPRDAYQGLFPVGMGKRYSGSHYVTGHSSPDLDTTVASFWGWLDAFAARIGSGVHIWNLPGGPPVAQVEIQFLFEELFGKSVFEHLPKTRTSLSLSGIDLLCQQGVMRKEIHRSTLNIEHDVDLQAVLLIDKQGRYLGNWSSDDVDRVRQVINWLNSCLRWLENRIHVNLITLFTQEHLTQEALSLCITDILNMKISKTDPTKEFSDRQRSWLNVYMTKVLSIPSGIECSFREFTQAMHKLSLPDFTKFAELVEGIQCGIEKNRIAIFETLEKIIRSLDLAIYSLRQYVERLDIALQIREEVFGSSATCVSHRADLEEIRSKIGTHPYITVTASDGEGLIPLGVIYAHDLHKTTLGTVTLRDFCNREETKIPSYLEIISVIDHHKSALQTFAASMVSISDAQSANVLCAEKAFAINDAHSTYGLNAKEIQAQLQGLNPTSSSERRIMQRLLQKASVADRTDRHFIDPAREYVEYLHFLYAILDDTDLLTKMTFRDVECVASLLNRMKSISLKQEVEIISLDDLPRDNSFVAKASERILNHPDMRSLYKKIYQQKEALINKTCLAAAKGAPTSLFDDTKEQNGCNRVGQTKIFEGNYPIFSEHKHSLRSLWYNRALQIHQDKPEIDLHMHMISTISGGEPLSQNHQDELWIWIPFTEASIEHLKGFLNAFQQLPQWRDHPPIVELAGSSASEYARIFHESFLSIAQKTGSSAAPLPIAVLKYPAGLLNSRKAMISPYLPRL